MNRATLIAHLEQRSPTRIFTRTSDPHGDLRRIISDHVDKIYAAFERDGELIYQRGARSVNFAAIVDQDAVEVLIDIS